MFKWSTDFFKLKPSAIHQQVFQQRCASNHYALINFINDGKCVAVKSKNTSNFYYSGKIESFCGLSIFTTYHNKDGDILHFE